MRTEHRIIVFSIILGFLVWIFDTFLDYFVFLKGTFWGLLILDVPDHEMYIRSLILCLFIGFGVILSRIVSRLRAAKDALQSSNARLETRVKERTADLAAAKSQLELELTQRRTAEEELRLERKRLVGIMDAMHEGVCIVNQHHHIEYVNPSIERQFGPFNGGMCHEYFHNSPDICAWCENKGVLSDKMAHREWRHSKTEKTYDLFDLPILNMDGSISRLHMFHDISARKRAEEELRRSREELRALASHLQSVREEERTRVAREIHDELGEILTSLSMDLTWLARKLSKTGAGIDPALFESLESMSKNVDTAVRLVREIASRLRPGVLDAVGLIAAIEWQTARFQDRTGIECHLNLPSGELPLDRDRSTALFRIFQEIVTNVARHANATEMTTSLTKEPGEIVLEVNDNGRGIIDTEINDSRAFGIMGMTERATALGGELHIEGTRGKGTKVVVRVPPAP